MSFLEQQRHVDTESKITNKNFQFSSKPLKNFFFVASILTIIVLFVALYVLCKHTKLRTLKDWLYTNYSITAI